MELPRERTDSPCADQWAIGMEGIRPSRTVVRRDGKMKVPTYYLGSGGDGGADHPEPEQPKVSPSSLPDASAGSCPSVQVAQRKIKGVVVRLALWGLVPLPVAEFLIKWFGLRHV